MHDQQGAGNGSLLMTSASALGHFCRQKNADLHRRQHLVRFERFANCRHAVVTDAPERTITVIRDFIGRC